MTSQSSRPALLTAQDLPRILWAIEQLRDTIAVPQTDPKKLPAEIVERMGALQPSDKLVPGFVIRCAGELLQEALQPAGVNTAGKPEIDNAQLPTTMRVQLGRLWQRLATPLWSYGAAREGRDEWLVFLDETAAAVKAPAQADAEKKIGVAAEPSAVQTAADGAAQKLATKGKHINERILATLQKDPESVSWSIRDWRNHLRCAISTIQDTPAWETIKKARAIHAADSGANREKEGQRDSRRRSKRRSVGD